MTYNDNYFREYYQRQDHQVVEAASVEGVIYQEWDEAQEAILEEVVGIEEEVRMLTIYSIIIILELNWHTKFLRKYQPYQRFLSGGRGNVHFQTSVDRRPSKIKITGFDNDDKVTLIFINLSL